MVVKKDRLTEEEWVKVFAAIALLIILGFAVKNELWPLVKQVYDQFIR